MIKLSSPLIFLLTVSTAQAAPVKSVDEHGNVTYSDEPVAGAVATEVVPVDPAPPEERVEAAKERAEEIQRLADEARQERLKKEELAAKERAEKAKAEPKVIVIDNSKNDNGGYFYPRYYPGGPIKPPVVRPPTQPKPPETSPPPGAISPPIARPQERAGN